MELRVMAQYLHRKKEEADPAKLWANLRQLIPADKHRTAAAAMVFAFGESACAECTQMLDDAGLVAVWDGEDGSRMVWHADLRHGAFLPFQEIPQSS